MSVYNTKRKFDEDDDNKAKRKLLPSMLEHYKIIGEYTGEQENIPITEIKDLNKKMDETIYKIADIVGSPIKISTGNPAIPFTLDFNYNAIASKMSSIFIDIKNYFNIVNGLNSSQINRIPLEDFRLLQQQSDNIYNSLKDAGKLFFDGLRPLDTTENMDILKKIRNVINLSKDFIKLVSDTSKEYNQLVNRKKLLIKKGGCLCDVNDMVYNARKWKEPSEYI